MLICAALLTACNSTSEPSLVETYVVALPVQSTVSYFDVHQENRQLQRNNLITSDFIEASYQAILQLHQEELSQNLMASLKEKIETAYNENKGSVKLQRIQEMLYSLSQGMMMPVHSREVGKEFSKIYKANKAEMSPTLGSEVDYTKFSFNSGVCNLSDEQKRTMRLFTYMSVIPKSLMSELALVSPSLVNTAGALFNYSKTQIDAQKNTLMTNIGTTQPLSCFEYSLARSGVAEKLSFDINSSIYDLVSITENFDEKLDGKSGKGLVISSTKSVALEGNTALYSDFVNHLQELNTASKTKVMAQVIPLFDKIAALANKQELKETFTKQEIEFLNSIDRKLAAIIGDKAKPFQMLTVSVNADQQEKLLNIKWKNTFTTSELISNEGKFFGVKICTPLFVETVTLSTLAQLKVPLCE